MFLDILRVPTFKISQKYLLLARQYHFSAHNDDIKQYNNFCLSLSLSLRRMIIGIIQYHSESIQVNFSVILNYLKDVKCVQLLPLIHLQ